MSIKHRKQTCKTELLHVRLISPNHSHLNKCPLLPQAKKPSIHPWLSPCIPHKESISTTCLLDSHKISWIYLLSLSNSVSILLAPSHHHLLLGLLQQLSSWSPCFYPTHTSIISSQDSSQHDPFKSQSTLLLCSKPSKVFSLTQSKSQRLRVVARPYKSCPLPQLYSSELISYCFPCSLYS